MRLLVRARAKINWTLDVLGQRPDGYHELDMLISSVTLCDQMDIREAEDLSLLLASNRHSFIPADDRNLVMRAAQMLRESAGIRKGAEIRLHKYIPVCAGMGGGSSDAAGALMALNHLWNCQLSLEELCRIGLKIGADVPFCLHGGLCRVKGIGEQVMERPMGRAIYLITIQPGRGLSTKEVFESLHTEGINPADRPDNEAAEQALADGHMRELVSAMGNVLEPVSVRKRPKICEALKDLRENGAIGAQMTGSGSVVFGIYPNAYRCRAALEELQKKYPNARAMHTVDSGIEITEEE